MLGTLTVAYSHLYVSYYYKVRELKASNKVIEYHLKRKACQRNAKGWKRRLVNIHGSICNYCNKHIDKNKLTIDHYKPLTYGGTNDFDNLRLSCLKCNRTKANMMPKEWESLRKSTKVS